MTEPVFVDTNVLVYARDSAAGDKQRLAAAWMEYLWKTQEGRLSVQVLTEFYVRVTAKLRPGMAPEAARRDVRALMAWRPRSVEGSTVEGAWLLQDRYGLAWWDALIVSAAQVADCRYLISEDFQAGQDLGGVRVVNPFATSPDQLAAADISGGRPGREAGRDWQRRPAGGGAA
jgi:predicted nucleic acid-binding protein